MADKPTGLMEESKTVSDAVAEASTKKDTPNGKKQKLSPEGHEALAALVLSVADNAAKIRNKVGEAFAPSSAPYRSANSLFQWSQQLLADLQSRYVTDCKADFQSSPYRPKERDGLKG